MVLYLADSKNYRIAWKNEIWDFSAGSLDYASAAERNELQIAFLYY